MPKTYFRITMVCQSSMEADLLQENLFEKTIPGGRVKLVEEVVEVDAEEVSSLFEEEESSDDESSEDEDPES